MESFTVVTAYANKADAVQMSIVGGEQQFTFAGQAVEKANPNTASPTYCYSTGQVVDGTRAVFDADNRFTTDDRWGASGVQQALDALGLQPWYDPNQEA